MQTTSLHLSPALGILVAILIACAVVWGIVKLISEVPVNDTLKQLAYVGVFIGVIVFLLWLFGIGI